MFLSGLFGANAVRSPLTDLEGRSDLTADQLEAAIDATLKTTADPKATLAALLRSMHPVQAGDGFTSEIVLDPREPLVDDMRAVLVAAATISAVRRTGADRGRYLVSTGLARYCAVAQRKTWVVRTREVDRKELINVIGVALLPDPQSNAEAVLSELHPISDAPGFAAEAYPFRIEDQARQRLVLNTLGAGATVKGAVERQVKDGGRYFVSTDFYKTLLMMRAAAIPAFRMDARALAPSPALQPRVLQSEPAPPRIAAHPQAQPGHQPHQPAPIVPQIPANLAPSTPPPLPVQRAAPPMSHPERQSRGGSGELETSLGNNIRNELIQLGGLFPWDARDIAIARQLGRNSEPEKALVRLQVRAPRLSRLVSDAIDDNRNSVRAAFDDLTAHHGHDPVYKQVLETVAGELDGLMPVLMLSPGGPYQQILEGMIRELEPQDGDGALSPADHRILESARGQVEAFKALADNRPDRLTYVARYIDHYDERLLSAHVAQHGEQGGAKRTLN